MQPRVFVAELHIAIEDDRPQLHVMTEGVADDDLAAGLAQDNEAGSVSDGEQHADRDQDADRMALGHAGTVVPRL